MKRLLTIIFALTLLFSITNTVFADEESFDYLMSKAIEFIEAGKLNKAEETACKALKSAQKNYGPENTKTAECLLFLGYINYLKKDYKNAELLTRRSLKINEKVLGGEHPIVLKTLGVLAKICRLQSRYFEAEQLYKRSLEISRKILNTNNPDVAESLYNLASLYQTQGRYSKAEPLYIESLKIKEKAFGKEHVEVALVLNSLAGLYMDQGQYSKAELTYKRSLIITEKVFGKEHPNTAVSLSNLALLYHRQGRYSDSELFYIRALKIEEKIFGKKHPDLASTLNNLAGLYVIQCRYFDAERLHKRSLRIQEKAFGKQHYKVAVGYNNLAMLYYKQGLYSKAEMLFKKALRIVINNFGEEHPFAAKSLSNLALLCKSQGRYFEAETLCKRSLKIREKILGKNHPEIALNLNNLAGLYNKQGRFAEAELLYKKSLKIFINVFGNEHPDVALAFNNLAKFYYEHGRYSDAEQLYKKSLKILLKTVGEKNIDVATIYNNLAPLYISQGRYSDAELFYKKSLKVSENIVGRDHPFVATNLNNLAILYESRGRYPEAKLLFERSLKISENVFGGNHPDVALYLTNLSSIYTDSGNYFDAFHLVKKAMFIDQITISDVFKTSSEKQKFQFINLINFRYELFLSLISKYLSENPGALTAGLNAVLSRKGAVLEALSVEMEAFSSSDNPEANKVLIRLREVSGFISSLTIAGPGKMKPEEYRKKLEELYAERKELEKKLAGMSEEFAAKKKREQADCKTVSESLPKGSFLVEYVNFRLYDFKEKKWGTSEYYAFVLASAKDNPSGNIPVPKLVYLGKASEIDKAVKSYRKEINKTTILFKSGVFDEQKALKRLSDKGKRLYELVVAPVKNVIGESKVLYVSPDGALNLIPFEALQDEAGNFLITDYDIRYLSSGRDLLTYQVKNRTNNKRTVIIADPDYNLSDSERAAQRKTLVADNTSGFTLRGNRQSRNLSAIKWKRLPGTREEAGEIKKLIGKGEVKVFTDKSALEEVVKRIKSPRRLHIATHGFFMKDQKIEKPLQNSLMISNRNSPMMNLSKYENPLLRSGLVFAGANMAGSYDRSSNVDDGILTAYEVSGMRLYNTDLVVLSACQTGMGDITPGEGVFGLRRAFQLAGARTVVMSLWSVPDADTRDLMVEFYRRMEKGEGKSEAFRNAKLHVMKSKKHPLFWASFIMTGEH